MPPGFDFSSRSRGFSTRVASARRAVSAHRCHDNSRRNDARGAGACRADEPRLATPLDYLLYVPLSYLYSVVELLRYALSHPTLIAEGATFSASLLAILFSHEMGHYLACRYYKVNATLPYFIPAPPLFLAGTFGAFIKIRSAIPSRRALFDIGLAGPLAGFVVALPVSVIGVLTMGPPLAPARSLDLLQRSAVVSFD